MSTKAIVPLPVKLSWTASVVHINLIRATVESLDMRVPTPATMASGCSQRDAVRQHMAQYH